MPGREEEEEDEGMVPLAGVPRGDGRVDFISKISNFKTGKRTVLHSY